MAWLRCGRFGRPHGVRGELRLWPENPDTTLLQAGREIAVGPEEGPDARYSLTSVRHDARGALVRLAGVDSREAAAALTDRCWFETRAAFEPLGDAEYYVADLVGMRVRAVDGRPLGRVRDVWNFGGGDILVLDDDGREVLVPFAGDHVDVDVQAREVVVRIEEEDETPSRG